MSLAEIEAELVKLGPEELRSLAHKSWMAFQRKEGRTNEINEDDPQLLTALDEAISKADSTSTQGHSAAAVRQRLKEWTSK